MKRWRLFLVVSGLLLAIIGLLAISGGAWAARGEPGPPTLEKVVFVHYPRSHTAKPPWAGGGNGGKTCPFKVSKDKWAVLPVSYWVNLSGSEYSDTDADTTNDSGVFLTGIQDGFQVWEDVLATNHVEFAGRNDGLPISSLDDYTDGLNVVGWADLSADYPNAIAVTIYWRYPWGEVVEADMALNTYYDWRQHNVTGDPDTFTDGSSDMDLQNIVAHEAGHAVGPLLDLYDSNAVDQTMYGYSSEGEVKKRSLECGDENGIEKLYGGGGKGGGKGKKK